MSQVCSQSHTICPWLESSDAAAGWRLRPKKYIYSYSVYRHRAWPVYCWNIIVCKIPMWWRHRRSRWQAMLRARMFDSFRIVSYMSSEGLYEVKEGRRIGWLICYSDRYMLLWFSFSYLLSVMHVIYNP